MLNTTRLLKNIDAWIGPAILALMPRPRHKAVRISSPSRILFIRPGGMGDALLLLPAIKAASDHFPGTRVDVLCEKRNKGVFQAVTFVDSIYSYGNILEFTNILTNRYDIVVDTEQSHYLSAVTAKIIRAGVKAGFQVNGRHKFYNISIPYSHSKYEADSFWDLTWKAIGGEKKFCWDYPYFPLSKNKPLFPSKEKYICLFPGATIEERIWPEQRWSDVAAWIAENGYTCILLGAQKETLQCRNILEMSPGKNILNLCGRLNVADTAALLKNAALLVSMDSGILHLGVLAGTPTVSLFGSGIADKWAPKGPNHICIDKKLPCSPCTKFGTTPPCKNFKACLLQITPEDVIKGIKRLLNT